MKELSVYEATKNYLKGGLCIEYKNGDIFYSLESDENLHFINNQLKRNFGGYIKCS